MVSEQREQRQENVNHLQSKNLPAIAGEYTLLFIEFLQACDSINRTKMKDILIMYGLPHRAREKAFSLALWFTH